MASRRVTAPATVGASYSKDVAQSPSLMVAVRVRPLLEGEQKKRDILRVLDSKLVTVLDPDTSKDYLDQMSGRNKEKSYTFDVAFDTKASNHEVYDRVIKGVVGHVLEGVNTTVFAYGATGSGKTHTMVGNASDPGLMVLSLQRIFEERAARFAGEEVEVDCSYLEVGRGRGRCRACPCSERFVAVTGDS